jgi:hypothetical protein
MMPPGAMEATADKAELDRLYNELSALTEVIYSRIGEWCDEDNAESLRGFATDLEQDAGKLGSIARELRTLYPA